MTGHGYGAYTTGCRCEVCRKAKADYMRDRRAAGRTVAQRYTVGSNGQRPTRGTAREPGAVRYIAPVERHGTRYAYEERGCRCFPCTDVRMESDRRKPSYRSAS